MRFIYLTSKQYPGGTADHNYIKELATAFDKELGEAFTFVVCNTQKNVLPNLPILSINFPRIIKRTVIFFLWIPQYWYKNFNHLKNTPVIFFSNDLNLLSILIFWKWLLHLPYTIVSDWHLLTNTWKDKFVVSHSNFSLTTSENLKKILQKLTPHAVIHTVYGGVSLQKYQVNTNREKRRNTLSLPLNKVLIGYVGRFKTMGMEKGIITMIDTLSFLDQEIAMVFVGGTEAEIKEYTQYAKEKGVSEQCIWFPIQSFERIVEYEQALDILVIPYPDEPHFRHYGFPMKVYEYMASNTPIIYTKLPLADEILNDCAYPVLPNDPRAFADMINFLHIHIDEAKEKALIARKKVEKYTWIEKAKHIIHLSTTRPSV